MARSQKKINIIITAENKRLKKDLAKAKAMVKSQGGKAGKEWSSGFLEKTKAHLDKSMGSLLGNIGANAASKALGALTGAFRTAFVEAKEFSRQFTNINTLLPKTTRLTDEMRKSMLNLSNEFGTSRAKQAGAFYQIVSAGIENNATRLKVLRQANIAAAAGITDVDTATKALVGVMNSYAGSNLTVEKASDQMFLAVKRGLTTFPELSESIGRVTPMANAAGVTFGELTGTLGFLTKQGIRTDEAVTGMRGILRALIKPAAETEGIIKALGLNIGVGEIKTRGFVSVLEELKQKTGGNVDVLGKLFPRVQALTAVIPILSGNFDEYKDIVKESMGASGEAVEAFGAKQRDLQLQTDKMVRSITNVKGAILSKFEPSLVMASKVVTGLMSDFANFIGSFDTPGKELLKTLTDINKAQEMMGPLLPGTEQGKKGSTNESDKKAGELALLQIQQAEAEKAFEARTKTALSKLTNAYLNFGLTKEQVIKASAERERQIALDGVNANLITAQAGHDKVLQINEKERQELEKLKKGAIDLSSSIKSSIGSMAVDAFTRLGDSIVNSQNAFSGFWKSMMGMLGDLAMQMGQTLFLAGVGIESLWGLEGAGAIAAGLGLMAVGGILKAMSGGQSSDTDTATGGAGGTAGTTVDQDLLLGDDEGDREEKGASVTLNVQGDILDSEDTGTRLITLLNDAFDTKGAMITQNIG